MFKTLLLENHNTTFCKIIMQSCLNSVYSKMYKPLPPDQNWCPRIGLKFQIQVWDNQNQMCTIIM